MNKIQWRANPFSLGLIKHYLMKAARLLLRFVSVGEELRLYTVIGNILFSKCLILTVNKEKGILKKEVVRKHLISCVNTRTQS